MPSYLKARGLFTLQNELSEIPEGSQLRADNVIIDRDGIIEPRRGFKTFGDEFPSNSDRAKQLISYKTRILRHFGTTLQYDSTGNGDFEDFSGIYTEVINGLRIKSIEQNGNLYFTTNDGVKKLSVSDPSQFPLTTITNAGGVKALDITGKVNYTTSGFLTPESKTAYRLVWAVRDANNNFIAGSPSARTVIINTATGSEVEEVSEITITDAIKPATGEYFLINSASDVIKYFVWYDITGTDTQPTAANTVGRVAIRVDISDVGVTTATDVAQLTAIELAATGSFETFTSGAVVTVTNVNIGPTTDPVDGTGNGKFTVTILSQGADTDGQSAVVDLTFTIPPEVTGTDHFFQLYRTAVVQRSEFTSLNDVDPGDEMNLVLERNITDAELSSGIVTEQDITPEDFRQGGTLLYTNPNSGDGIEQANEVPPLCQDIASFRNSTFYANTVSKHSKNLNLLSISDFTTEVSKLLIANNNIVREYTFVGSKEQTDVDFTSYTGAVDGSGLDGLYFTINSSSDDRGYYFWYNTGSSIDPLVSGRIGVEINVNAATSLSEVVSITSGVVSAVADFSTNIVSLNIEVTTTNNGDVTHVPTTNIPDSFSITVDTEGTGEDAASNEVLLSGLDSPSQAIDETARSLIKVINLDDDSPVSAFYLSGPDDVPGQILLQNRSNADIPFYLAVNESVLQDKFNPELPLLRTDITAIDLGDPSQITTGAVHDLSAGQSVVIFDSDSIPDVDGVHLVSIVDTTKFTIPVDVTTLAGTSASWFVASEASDNEVAPNRIFFSKTQQPEAVPLVNFLDVGPKDKAILRILALRDSLFIFKEDGVYRLTGQVAPNFSVSLFDGSTTILAADTAAVLNNQIYVLSDQGIATVTDTGVSVVSRSIEDQIKAVTTDAFTNFNTISFATGYETDRAYIIWLPTTTSDTSARQAFRYNTFTNTWTRWTRNDVCVIVNPEDDRLYLGAGDSNIIVQERKLFDRTDYADLQFGRTIVADAVDEDNVNISSISDIVIGDLLQQIQYLTLTDVRRVLNKLDNDLYVIDDDYYETLNPIPGANLSNITGELATKLNNDAGTYIVAGVSFTYTTLGNIVTVTSSSHGLETGEYIYITGTGDSLLDSTTPASNPNDLPHQIVVLNSDTFTMIVPDISGSGSGDYTNQFKFDNTTDFESIQTQWNIIIHKLNANTGVFRSNYLTSNGTIPIESRIVEIKPQTNTLVTADPSQFVEGPVTIYQGIKTDVIWAPNAFEDPSIFKQVSQGTLIFENNSFSTASVLYNTDLSPSFTEIPFNFPGAGVWGLFNWGEVNWGGFGNQAPLRTLIPQGKQRCRYIQCRFKHGNAFEKYAILGISFVQRPYSERAYK